MRRGTDLENALLRRKLTQYVRLAEDYAAWVPVEPADFYDGGEWYPRIGTPRLPQPAYKPSPNFTGPPTYPRGLPLPPDVRYGARVDLHLLPSPGMRGPDPDRRSPPRDPHRRPVSPDSGLGSQGSPTDHGPPRPDYNTTQSLPR